MGGDDVASASFFLECWTDLNLSPETDQLDLCEVRKAMETLEAML